MRVSPPYLKHTATKRILVGYCQRTTAEEIWAGYDPVSRPRSTGAPDRNLRVHLYRGHQADAAPARLHDLTSRASWIDLRLGARCANKTTSQLNERDTKRVKTFVRAALFEVFEYRPDLKKRKTAMASLEFKENAVELEAKPNKRKKTASQGGKNLRRESTQKKGVAPRFNTDRVSGHEGNQLPRGHEAGPKSSMSSAFADVPHKDRGSPAASPAPTPSPPTPTGATTPVSPSPEPANTDNTRTDEEMPGTRREFVNPNPPLTPSSTLADAITSDRDARQTWEARKAENAGLQPYEQLLEALRKEYEQLHRMANTQQEIAQQTANELAVKRDQEGFNLQISKVLKEGRVGFSDQQENLFTHVEDFMRTNAYRDLKERASAYLDEKSGANLNACEGEKKDEENNDGEDGETDNESEEDSN
jgi:hypothetical protein